MSQTTEWNLTELYESIDDPQLDKDVAKVERAHKKFAKSYREKKLSTVATLKKALVDYEKLFSLPKPISYLFLLKSIHTDDKSIDAKIAQLHERLVKASNFTLFFEIELARLTKDEQKKLLASPSLREYEYFLSRVFAGSKHLLSEGEEAVLQSLSLPASEMWVDLTERLVNREVVEVKGESVPLSEAMNRIASLSTKDRRALHSSVMQKLGESADVAEAEMNALLTKKKITDSARNFKTPYASTLLDFETTNRELRALRDVVYENAYVSHGFYDLKRDMMRLKQLTYADRNAEIGKIKTTFTFEDSKQILRGVFEGVDPRATEVLEDMLQNRRIDVFPRKGKTSGAFCYGTTEFPTYVLLNHVDTFDSLSTFAHEMGHAIHTELSKEERPLYQGYSTAVAEFASTFFEDLLFSAVFEKLSKREQKVLLHNRINRDISTIFRQMAFFEFEVALHEEARTAGYVPKERIAELINKYTADYLGPAVEITPEDGNFFVVLSHIRRFFYVYSYAYGAIMSRTLSRRAKEDPEVLRGVLGLLSRGASASPKELFKSLGVNTERRDTYEAGIESIKADIEELRNL